MNAILAVVYSDPQDLDSIFSRIVDAMLQAGRRVAGTLQSSVPVPGRRHCMIIVRDLVSGECFPISEHRGEGARGCRLDRDELVKSAAAVATSLTPDTDLLIVNKFGKAECEGGGFRSAMGRAVDLGIPILVGVPERNIQLWRAFAGELASECSPGLSDVTRWLAKRCSLEQAA